MADENGGDEIGLIPDEVELDEFGDAEEEDGFAQDNFDDDQESNATYDIGFAQSDNESDGEQFHDVQQGFELSADDDEARAEPQSTYSPHSPSYVPTDPDYHATSRRDRQSNRQSDRPSDRQPGSMSWAVREMPLERPGNGRRPRWPLNDSQDVSQYIMLNPESGASMRKGRTTVSAPTLCSITETQARLARSAALCVKEAASLLKSEVIEPLDHRQRAEMAKSVEQILQPVWNWVLVVMDWTESQLRFGVSLNKSGEMKYPKSDSKSKKPIKSHDYLTYALSLLRQGSSEHSDLLPSIDISSLKHIAYVLDSMVYLFKQDMSLFSVDQPMQESPRTGPRNTFFRRSESMLFLGANEEETFELSNAESLPLSEQPHLLRPNSTKEELFGRAGKRETQPTGLDIQTKMALGVSHDMAKAGYLTGDQKIGPDGLLNRWRKSVELFARVFMDDVGSEEGSILRQLASFTLRQQKFQKQMEALRQTQKQSELKIEVHRPREKLIPETIKKLNHEYQKVRERARKNEATKDSQLHQEGAAFWGVVDRSAPNPTRWYPNMHLMVARKIKVRFFDEPGEGNGVMRSFFTTIADSLLSSEKLPPMDHGQQPQPESPPKHQSAETTLRRSGLSGLSRMGRAHRWDREIKLDITAEEWRPETGSRDDARFKFKDRVYKTASQDFGQNAAKITGMLGTMSSGQVMNCLHDEEQLKLKILEASKLLKDAQKWKVSFRIKLQALI